MSVVSAADRQRVETHLDELFESEPFSSSRRCREFLRYIVLETLEGRGAAIKERTIAMDVFGKGADFDSQSESIVRVKANDVRKRLACAYTSGLQGDVRISLPVGVYHPEFQFAEGEARAALVEPERPRRRRWPAPVLAGAVWVAAVVALALWLSPARPFDPLWAPFTAPGRAVLISLPAPPVFELRNPEMLAQLREDKEIPASEVREAETYTGLGAAYGAARFAEQLALRGKTFQLKFGQDVTFSDLRQGPAILLGAMTSQWTLDITQSLRFRFEKSANVNRIVDASAAKRYWMPIPVSAGHPNAESFALVTRLMASDSGYPVLMAAGLSAHDTQAAVEFLTSATCFEQFARQAPDWGRKNFQVVLRVFVHGNSPGSPAVVAWHLW
ncbi:MAG: hypothetical protein KGN36_02120 [Acidobacteriota bacterium]|nr:hypothetical protein [Acidobacteriota bacterium]